MAHLVIKSIINAVESVGRNTSTQIDVSLNGNILSGEYGEIA